MHIAVEFQNRRPYMEDRFLITEIEKNKTLYGVFDGHGGYEIAQMCKDNVGEIFKQCLIMFPHDISVAMHKCFELVDKLAEKANKAGVGSTMGLCYITPERAWFANAGDTMSMIHYKSGGCELMSYEHKVEVEKERIQLAGGTITYWDGVARINGMLNVARSIGDYHLKPYVISTPFVRTVNRKHSDFGYIMMASDGIWDVYKPESLAFDLKHFMEQDPAAGLKGAMTEIVKAAAGIRGSGDNITMIFIGNDQSL